MSTFLLNLMLGASIYIFVFGFCIPSIYQAWLNNKLDNPDTARARPLMMGDSRDARNLKLNDTLNKDTGISLNYSNTHDSMKEQMIEGLNDSKKSWYFRIFWITFTAILTLQTAVAALAIFSENFQLQQITTSVEVRLYDIVIAAAAIGFTIFMYIKQRRKSNKLLAELDQICDSFYVDKPMTYKSIESWEYHIYTRKKALEELI